MSDKTTKAVAEELVEEVTSAADTTTGEPLKAVIASGVVINTTTITNQPWFSVWVPQTFPGPVSGGFAQPMASGNGWGGSNNAGFVFQNDQYNTTVRGF
jgi:hypothetical protein